MIFDRYVCGANFNVGTSCSHNDAVGVIEEGLEGVKTVLDQCKCAPVVSTPSTTTSRTTFDTAMPLDGHTLVYILYIDRVRRISPRIATKWRSI